MAGSLEGNKIVAAILTAGIIAQAAGVFSRIIYAPHHLEEDAFKVEVAPPAGSAPEKAAPEKPLPVLLASADVKVGEQSAGVCKACHNFAEGAGNKIGPDLWDVVDRDIASKSDFAYSDALKAKKGKWTYDDLFQWLKSPRDWAPGTKMTFAGIGSPEKRADVIAYLRTLSEHPQPLPEVKEQAAAPAAAGGAPAAPAGAPAAAAATPAAPAAAPAAAAGAPAAASAEPAKAGAAPAAQQAAATGGGGGDQFAAQVAAATPEEGAKDVGLCKVCHNFAKGGGKKIGPDLWGVVGRKIASAPGFDYSDALKSKEGDWTYDKLNEWLTDPRGWAPGTKMVFVGIKDEKKRAAVVSYLRSLSDNPAPLPQPKG